MYISETMASLIKRRDTIYSDLNSMTKTSVGGKPNAMSADSGTSVDHVKWRLSLYQELREINKLILEQEAIDSAISGSGGSFEYRTPLA